MSQSTSQAAKQAEDLEQLRRELLARLVRSEAERRQAAKEVHR